MKFYSLIPVPHLKIRALRITPQWDDTIYHLIFSITVSKENLTHRSPNFSYLRLTGFSQQLYVTAATTTTSTHTPFSQNISFNVFCLIWVCSSFMSWTHSMKSWGLCFSKKLSCTQAVSWETIPFHFSTCLAEPFWLLKVCSFSHIHLNLISAPHLWFLSWLPWLRSLWVMSLSSV